MHSCKLNLTVLRSSASLQPVHKVTSYLQTCGSGSDERYIVRLFLKTAGQSNKLGRTPRFHLESHRSSSSTQTLFSTDGPKYSYVLIRYRDESLSLIGMHNGCHSNRNLDTERVTGSVDNSQSRGDKERRRDETVSQRRAGNLRGGVLEQCGSVQESAARSSADYVVVYNVCNITLKMPTRHER